jgi:deoxycytidine triphosphate deaminase
MTAWNDVRYKQNPSVSPFEAALINPASVDLRLGNQLRRVHPLWSHLSPSNLRDLCEGETTLPYRTHHLLTEAEMELYVASDSNFDALPKWGEVETFAETWLMPGGFVLCSSLETVTVPDDAVALLFSKSSTGRNGLEHLHAGLGDPGFVGTWTWELHNVAPWPIRLEAGKRLMQHIFIRLDAAPLRTYAATGRYQGQQGPTPAREVQP